MSLCKTKFENLVRKISILATVFLFSILIGAENYITRLTDERFLSFFLQNYGILIFFFNPF